MKALAVDLGGSHATCALVEDRILLASRTVSADGTGSLGPLLPLLAETLKSLVPGPAAACAGLAFGFCGLADYTTGRVVSTNAKYDDGPSLDLNAWCRQALGIPFRIENDARLALLGEWYAGAARGHDDVVMVTLGTGIGGAAMVQGKLLRGKHAQAGCLGGHLPACVPGRPCTCGALGCAEAEASSVALPEVSRSFAGYPSSALAADEPVTFEKVFRYSLQGDAVAKAICDCSLQIWGANLVGLIHAYDPELIVMGGGVMKSAPQILPFLQTYVKQHAWTPWGKVKVCGAELGTSAALLGAIPLVQGLADL